MIPLVSRVGPQAQPGAHPQRSPERLERVGEDHLRSVPLADRPLLIPDHHPGNSPELADDLQVPAQHVVRLAGGDHPAAQELREPQRTDYHPQLLRLAVTDRDQHVGLPQVELGQLAGAITGPLTRIGRHEQRAQLGDPVPQHRHPMRPPDPIRDHRRRHRRKLPQQPKDLRLHGVDDRTRPSALITRRAIRADRLPDRVPRHLHMTGDRLDPHPLRPMQPADLSPIFHGDHRS